jgi:hypothetical protein
MTFLTYKQTPNPPLNLSEKITSNTAISTPTWTISTKNSPVNLSFIQQKNCLKKTNKTNPLSPESTLTSLPNPNNKNNPKAEWISVSNNCPKSELWLKKNQKEPKRTLKTSILQYMGLSPNRIVRKMS